MGKSVCFTGHREIKEDTKKLSAKLYEVLEKLVTEQDAADFYAGGAYGFDTIAALNVIRLRENYPQVKLHLLLPCPNAEQTRGWSAQQKYEFRCVLGRADSVTYTADRHYEGCMGLRNRKLVESAADFCVCYLEPKHKSGTSQTVEMAKKKGLTVINLYGSTRKT